MKDIHSIFGYHIRLFYNLICLFASDLGPTLFIQFVTNRIQLVITRPNTRTVVVMLSK